MQQAQARSGLGLVSAGAVAFGTSGTFATSLLDAGWTPGAAVTVRVFVAAAVLALPAALLLRGRRQALRRGSRSLVLYGLVAVAGCQLAYYTSVQTLDVAVALLLEYSGVLLVVLWVWWREGKRPRRLIIAGAVLAVAGLGLVLEIGGDVRLDPRGVFWALVAAVGLAVYFVLSARADDGLPALVTAFGGLSVAALVLVAAAAVGVLPMAAPRVDVTLLDAQVSWLVPVVGLSVVSGAFAFVAGIAGARRLGARLTSFVGLTEVLFAVVFAWLVLGQALTAAQAVGGVLVLAGIVLVRVDELRLPVTPEAVLSEEPRLARAA